MDFFIFFDDCRSLTESLNVCAPRSVVTVNGVHRHYEAFIVVSLFFYHIEVKGCCDGCIGFSRSLSVGACCCNGLVGSGCSLGFLLLAGSDIDVADGLEEEVEDDEGEEHH